MHIDKLPKLLFIFNQRSRMKNSPKINAYCNVMLLRRCVMTHATDRFPIGFRGSFNLVHSHKNLALWLLWRSILDTNKLAEVRSLLISISLQNGHTEKI